MLRKNINLIFGYIEVIVRTIVPISAAVIIVIKLMFPDIIDEKMVLKLILLIVSGFAISEGLSRFITLDNIRRKVEDLYNYDIPNQKLLEKANTSGIVNISTRLDNEWKEQIVREIRKSRTQLDICGVALPSVTENNDLRDAILDHADNYDVRFLLLDPKCPEANRRANIEKPLGTRTIADIEGTISILRQEMAKNKRIRIHLYKTPPMIGLYSTEHYLFMEPYHFGRPTGVDGCIGGHVPLLMIKNNPEYRMRNTYAYFREHFQYLWNDTRGGRVDLEFEPICFKNDSVVIKNKNGFSIKMAGWSLAAQGQSGAYQFENDFEWQNDEDCTVPIQCLEMKEDSNNNPIQSDTDKVITMQNSRGITVAQWPLGKFEKCSC